MGSQLKGQLKRIKGNLRMTVTTRQPLLRAGRKRTLEVSTIDEDGMEEEETGLSSAKNPRLQALLTEELLDHILSYVAVRDLKSCRLVEKHWNSVATARWKKRGVLLKVGGNSDSSGSLMDFVNFSRASGSSGGRTGVSTPPLLDNITGLFAEITDGNLVENPATMSSFAALCQSRLKILKLKMQLRAYQEEYQARVNSIKQLFTNFLANLEDLVLDFDDTCADIFFHPGNLQLERPNSPTKLKRLEILHYCCQVTQPSFELGFLAELLRESHHLEHLVFYLSRLALSTWSPCSCYKMFFNLLNSSTGGGQLRKVRQLDLRLNTKHRNKCRYCNARARANNREEAEMQGALFPNSRLQSLTFSRIPWKEMLNTFRHHHDTLLSLTIGAHVLPPESDNGEPDHALILPNLMEFYARAQLSFRFFTTLLTLFPQLGSLGLSNPTAEQLRFVWKHFVQLHKLSLHFVEGIPGDSIHSTASPAQDPPGVNILHLDSLLSGFSIDACELIYTKIDADSSILTKSLSEPPPLLASSNTVLNLAKLRSLEIARTRTSFGDLCTIRLTEVGLVLVLLKLGSLTQLTINSCTMLLPGTLSLIEQHVSPAMSISISQQPDLTWDELRQARRMWWV